MIESGEYSTLSELAAAEKITLPYVSRILRLALLAPDLMEAVLEGKQPPSMTLNGLQQPIPFDWNAQRRLFNLEERAFQGPPTNQ